MAVLCVLSDLCGENRLFSVVERFCTKYVQNEAVRCPEWVNKVLIPQSRDQSVDWRIAGVLKFEKAGKQENDKLRGCLN